MKISKELSTGTLPMLVLSVLGSEDLYGTGSSRPWRPAATMPFR